MPKAPSTRNHISATATSPSGVNPAPTVLKRNQACHQCRRKKLKCDAQVPCTACVKSYTYALKTHPTTAGPAPDCLYDDPNEVAEGSNAKYQKLEEKINRLEALLKEQQGPSRIADQNATFSYTVNDSENAFGYSSRISNASSPPTLFPSPMLSDVPPVLPSNTTQAINDLFAIIEPTSSMPIPSPGTSTGMFSQIVLEPNPLFLQLIDPSWPDNLPSPELLNHLIDTFFNCVPHATRVLHRPTFMSAMINHPSSPNFPHTAVLHAICAVASLYTPMITDQPENERIIAAAVPSFYSGVIPRAKPQLQTNGIYRKPGLEPIDNDRLSFGLLHARLAAQTFLRHVQSGYRMVELLQAMLIATWYHYSTGRSVDVWIGVGTVHHLVVPLGLNTSEGYTPVSYLPARALTVLPPPKSKLELEHQRTIFWLCYAAERLFTAGSVWPLCLNDEDIGQVLPIKLVDLVAGNEVNSSNRQTLMTPKMLTTHPPEVTDSFTLYVKGTILLGKVKTFNIRFKMKYSHMNGESIDPRETTEFQQLENVIAAFRMSFPPEFKKPIGEEGKVDPTLYMAHLLPHVAMILLHDPHAEMGSPNCFSSSKIRTATKAILELIYKISATSYDILLMDHAIAFCWLVCGTALVRFLKAYIAAGNQAEVVQITSEFEIVKFMLGNLGERTMIGHRQVKLLDEMYQQEIGKSPGPNFGYGSDTGASLQEI